MKDIPFAGKRCFASSTALLPSLRYPSGQLLVLYTSDSP